MGLSTRLLASIIALSPSAIVALPIEFSAGLGVSEIQYGDCTDLTKKTILDDNHIDQLTPPGASNYCVRHSQPTLNATVTTMLGDKFLVSLGLSTATQDIRHLRLARNGNTSLLSTTLAPQLEFTGQYAFTQNIFAGLSLAHRADELKAEDITASEITTFNEGTWWPGLTLQIKGAMTDRIQARAQLSYNQHKFKESIVTENMPRLFSGATPAKMFSGSITFTHNPHLDEETDDIDSKLASSDLPLNLDIGIEEVTVYIGDYTNTDKKPIYSILAASEDHGINLSNTNVLLGISGHFKKRFVFSVAGHIPINSDKQRIKTYAHNLDNDSLLAFSNPWYTPQSSLSAHIGYQWRSFTASAQYRRLALDGFMIDSYTGSNNNTYHPILEQKLSESSTSFLGIEGAVKKNLMSHLLIRAKIGYARSIRDLPGERETSTDGVVNYKGPLLENTPATLINMGLTLSYQR